MKKTKEYELQVGDKIKYSHAFGNGYHIVSRVTNTLAYVKVNDSAEIKFKRIVNALGVRKVPRDSWSTTKYEVDTQSILNNKFEL